MYYASDQLLAKLKESKQDIKPLVYITRPTTAMSAQRYWERQRVDAHGSACGIAVRRPIGRMLADRVYMSQVINGNVAIMYADVEDNLNEMVWTSLASISGATEVSLVFSEIMKKVSDKVEAYTTGTHPYVFWIDSAGTAKFRNLNNPSDISVGANAIKLATTAGLYSEPAEVDDGIFCFFVNTSGELWEARIHNDTVQEITDVTELPAGVTSWSDVWAGRTFDYRIALQLKGDDGNVYTLMSKSRPSGFRQDYIQVSNISISGNWGKEPPTLLSVETVGE